MSASPKDFRHRQVHLDFHTSEHITGIGADFDPAAFTRTLAEAKVDSVTLFARCHHGWAYYPSEHARAHPHLDRPDLLGDMVKACRAADIATPIYLTVQWDELTAREHPQWRVMQADNRAANNPGTEPSAGNQLTATWHPLCLNHPELVDRHIAIAGEVAKRFEPPALFMDILGSWQCTCNACLASMAAAGLDPLSTTDRCQNDRAVLMNFFERFGGAIHAKFPDVRIFYNSGHIFKGQTGRYAHYDHLEIESLPTGGWGYDHFPATARYAAGLGKPFLGMTGRFHSHWGEFGGYKTADALTYECCQMLMLGARCSIGDQLHPRGRLDRTAYDLIGPAYARIASLEPLAADALYQREVALLSIEAQQAWQVHTRGHSSTAADTVAARTLMELKIPFDTIEEDWDLALYRLLILPDEIEVDAALAGRLKSFVAEGGSILATGRSGLSADGAKLNLPLRAELAGMTDFNPVYMTTDGLDARLPAEPIVMYERPLGLASSGAKVLADVRPPYFNRTWDRFCSHLHTPQDPTAAPVGPAILEDGQVIHCAFSLFGLYGQTGQINYKRVIEALIARLLPEPLLGGELPSAARMSLMSQPQLRRDILHLLYAPTQMRGSAIHHNDGQTLPVEVIEDAPELRQLSVWARQDGQPAAVRCGYTGDELAWRYDSDSRRLHVTVPRMHIHAAIVIEHGKAR